MRLAPSVAVFAAASSASGLARTQPAETQPAPAPPPPIYSPTPSDSPTSSSPPPPYAPPSSYYVVPGGEKRAPGRLAAPRNALELSFGAGYTQGFGYLTRGVSLPSVATAGLGLDFGLGYRFSAHWALMWGGQYQELTAQRSDAAGGFASSLGAQYHFDPTHRIDPWVELGAGYRYLWESQQFGPVIQTHGFELAHLRAGLDLRADEQIAIGPVIGADATLFRWQDRPGYSVYLANPQVSWFVYAGVQARFDIGGTRSPTYATR
jgi:hypothetical protein